MRLLILSVLCTFINIVSAQEINKKEKERLQESFNADTTFIKDSINTRKAVILLNFHFSSLPYDFVVKYFNQIKKDYHEISEYKSLVKQINISKEVRRGKVIVNFSCYSNTNETTSLDFLLQKYSLVLIDIWASWCIPCRKNSEYLRALHEKYKDSSFTIFSISIDENKSDWQKAISDDRINLWYHCNDNKFESKLSFYAVPTYILVNNRFEIIGKFNGRWKGKEDLIMEIENYYRSKK